MNAIYESRTGGWYSCYNSATTCAGGGGTGVTVCGYGSYEDAVNMCHLFPANNLNILTGTGYGAYTSGLGFTVAGCGGLTYEYFWP